MENNKNLVYGEYRTKSLFIRTGYDDVHHNVVINTTPIFQYGGKEYTFIDTSVFDERIYLQHCFSLNDAAKLYEAVQRYIGHWTVHREKVASDHVVTAYCYNSIRRFQYDYYAYKEVAQVTFSVAEAFCPGVTYDIMLDKFYTSNILWVNAGSKDPFHFLDVAPDEDIVWVTRKAKT